jgi:hypothetical protein
MPVLQPVVQKLTRSNFSMWKALVISALKGTQFSEFLEGKADVQERTLFSDDKKMKMPNLEFAIHRQAAAGAKLSAFISIQRNA